MTFCPEQLVHLARVVEIHHIDSTVTVRQLKRPGGSAIAFGGAVVTDDPEECDDDTSSGPEEAVNSADVAEWRVIPSM